jgi:hypothetical protein
MKQETSSQQKFDTHAALQGVKQSRKQDIMEIKAKHAAADAKYTAQARAERGNVDTTDIGH